MLELYSLTGCPYCATVENKLDSLGLEYERHEVAPSRSHRPAVREVSGQAGVPVLVDPDEGVTGMPESNEIVAYLDRTYGQ
ncbi:glutaredoxin family protein [Halovivax cerinus]|uniref:Glutaredoxin family protein n=1 Tax=Halovivax cerinus TaxID=1487865 RepID=A0ABD5NSF5_9EURY|nr:glutathione S-transferase N-terminal domain-containing protein [Halovivax cerinus]